MPTLLEIATALGVLLVGIVVGEALAARLDRPRRGMPFHPRCRR